MEQKTFLYILELEDNRWYVGITGDLKKRLRRHSKGSAAMVTAKYPLVVVHDIMEGCKDLEREITLALMDKYGPDRVWGGAYTQTERIEDFYPPGLRDYRKTLVLAGNI